MDKNKMVFVPRVIYVRQLPKDKKLDLFKRVKGYCLWEGADLMYVMKGILDEKIKDVEAALAEEYFDCMTMYKDILNDRL